MGLTMQRVFHVTFLVSFVFMGAGTCTPGDDCGHPPRPPTIEQLEDMQKNPPKDYRARLLDVINGDFDPYLRERAVFTLVDIALRQGETDGIVPALESLGVSEGDDGVRTAAYAGVDAIFKTRPGGRKGSMELAVLGDVRTGEVVSVIVRVSSAVYVKEARVSLRPSPPLLFEALGGPENEPGKFYRTVSLFPNSVREVRFDLRLTGKGRTMLGADVVLDFNRFEYERHAGKIFFNVGDNGGDAFVLP
ncbi:MAG: hypothetical protein HY905_02400 [Deltaproteobacteria bacterium]|nr:hypothetical protein [Deltaproteobacteria bacterium]